MNKNFIIIGIILIVGFIIWVWYDSANSVITVPENTPTSSGDYIKTQSELDAEASGEVQTDSSAVIEEATVGDAAEPSETDVITKVNLPRERYVAYDPNLLTNGTNIVFFHATWCPSCRALEQSITNNIDKIPDDITIFKANYDSETALKQKYGVTRQHTLVIVDSDGNQIRTLTGLSSNLDQVLQQL